MRKVLQILGAAMLAVVLTLVLAGRSGSFQPRPLLPQWLATVQVLPTAMAQQPRETPPNIVPGPERSKAREESGWVGWALLLGIPALIVAWAVARRRWMRRDRDADE